MRIPKPAQTKPPPKPPPNSAKPEQLSVREVKKLTKAGKLDGHHSLPKEDEDGKWTSPLLQKEVNAYDEYSVFAWGELQEKHEKTHKEISHLCQEFHRMEEQLTALRKEVPLPPDLSARLNGEEKLSEKIVRKRRQNEFEEENAGYFNKLRQMEAKLDQTCRRLSEIHSTVQAAEKTTSMLCEREAGKAMKRITVYWQGALKTHPYYDEIPPTPEVSLESNAEADYYAQNQHVKEEAAQILQRGHYSSGSGSLTTNTRRMEGHHAFKQKQNRR